MNSILNELSYYFAFPFVRYALIVGVLIALCCALFGVTLVLKRFSFIGDGLSHAAFGAFGLAAVLSVSNEMIVVLPLCAVLAVFLLKAGTNAKIKGDAAIAMVSAGALAIGYLLLNIFPVSTNISGDVCSTLFGATLILSLSKADVVLCVVLCAAVIALFVMFYNRIFAVTFDENFAEATGIKPELYSSLIAIITAVIIVLSMKLVGTLLISALIIFPACAAMRVFKSFRAVTLCAAVISVICAAVGIVLSTLMSTPVGPSVVAVNILCFLIFAFIGKAALRQ